MPGNYGLNALQRLGILIENSSSFAVNQSGSQSYKDLKFISAEKTTDVNMLENATTQQRVDEMGKKIPGNRSCTLNVSTYLDSIGTPLSGGATPSYDALSDVLKVVMGGRWAATGSYIAVAGGGNLGSSTVNDSSGFHSGQVFGILDDDGNLEAGRIQKVDGTDLIYQFELSAVNSDGDSIYNAQTHYLTQDPCESLQALAESDIDAGIWVLMGMQGGFGLSIANEELPTIDFSFEGVNWTTGSATEMKQATYSYNMAAFTNSKILFGPAQTGEDTAAARVEIHAQAIEFTPNITYQNITTQKDNNVLRKRRTRSVPVATGQLTMYFTGSSSLGFWDDRDDETEYYMFIQVGNQPGKTTVISAPRVQIVDVQPAAAGEISGVTISWEALEDDVSNEGSNVDLARSAILVGRL